MPAWIDERTLAFTREQVVRRAFSPGLELTRPRRLFAYPVAPGAHGPDGFDVAADGRFLVVDREPAPRDRTATIILNWSPPRGRLVTYTFTMRESPEPLDRDPVIEAYKAGVDRTLIRERLKRTPAERAEDLVALARFAEELARAGDERRGSR